MLAVIVVSLLMIRNKHNNEDSHEKIDGGHEGESNINFLSDDPKAHFKRDNMETIRKRRKKEAQLVVVMRDIILHLTFVFFLAIVCYGNKNDDRFLMTRTMINPFMNFNLVGTDMIQNII